MRCRAALLSAVQYLTLVHSSYLILLIYAFGFLVDQVITRYDSGLATDGSWTTDSNCRESQLRRRNWRANWTVSLSEPVR